MLCTRRNWPPLELAGIEQALITHCKTSHLLPTALALLRSGWWKPSAPGQLHGSCCKPKHNNRSDSTPVCGRGGAEERGACPAGLDRGGHPCLPGAHAGPPARLLLAQTQVEPQSCLAHSLKVQVMEPEFGCRPNPRPWNPDTADAQERWLGLIQAYRAMTRAQVPVSGWWGGQTVPQGCAACITAPQSQPAAPED